MNPQQLVQEIERRYRGSRERLFIIHGNVNDLLPFDGELRTFPDYCYGSLTRDDAARRSRIWTHYSIGSGARWINAEASGPARVARLLGSDGEQRTTFITKPADLFSVIDDVCRRREKMVDGKDGAVAPLRAVITEAHMIFPEAPTQFLRPEDRQLIVQLQRFAREPAYDLTDTLIILVTDTLSSINRELREVAVTLELSLPSEQEASAFLDDAVTRWKTTVVPETRKALHRLVVGLSRRQIEGVVVECATMNAPLAPTLLSDRRKELTGRDYGEYLEFIEPGWTLDDVGGCIEATGEFRELAAALARGDADIPAGVIVSGQNGVGKTHILTGFAGTAGLTVAVLKPFKSSGYGDSEKAWGKIATALTSAGQIIVIVQEADAALGQRTGPNVHEVSKAILAQQLALMGDPKYRGKILWLLDTCRPDKLAPDVKRPGRCERMIPLFPETTPDGVRAILRAQVGLLTRSEGYLFARDFLASVGDDVAERLKGKTGAQIARCLRRARKRFAKGGLFTAAHLTEFLATGKVFCAEPEAYELQRLIAIAEAIETDNDDLVPPYYLEAWGGQGKLEIMKQRIEILRRRCDGV